MHAQVKKGLNAIQESRIEPYGRGALVIIPTLLPPHTQNQNYLPKMPTALQRLRWEIDLASLYRMTRVPRLSSFTV